MCRKMSHHLYLLSSHQDVIDYSLMKIQIPGIVSFILMCDSLGIIAWKHFVTETSRIEKSCIEAVYIATCCFVEI